MNNRPTIDLSRLPRPILEDHPDWVDLYHTAWTIASRNVRVTNGRAHMDAAWDPARNFQWVWDTCFMAMYCRYAPDQFPGVQSLDNFYDRQAADGHIGMTYDMTTGEEPWPNRINPPLFAWVEWEYYVATGDASRFPHASKHIEELAEWIDANRRNAPHRRRRDTDHPDEGRGESTDPYSLYYFEDGGSSGMDDAPRSPRVEEAGRHFDWIDLSCQMALTFRVLATMHKVMGNTDRATYWTTRHRELGALINDELWCPRTRFYHDRMIPTNFMGAKTIAGFWPLIAGICPGKRVGDLVDHLNNPAEFNRPIPVPSLSADDLNYDPRGTYWIGGVWAPTNYMVTQGLMHVGRHDVARDIATKYVSGLHDTFRRVTPHTLWECNSPEKPLPGTTAYSDRRVKPHFVGWSGLGPIAMLIENILGITTDVPSGTVTWRLHPRKKQFGIEELSLGRLGKVSLLCVKCDSRSARLHVQADSPIKLLLQLGKRRKSVRVTGGKAIDITI